MVRGMDQVAQGSASQRREPQSIAVATGHGLGGRQRLLIAWFQHLWPVSETYVEARGRCLSYLQKSARPIHRTSSLHSRPRIGHSAFQNYSLRSLSFRGRTFGPKSVDGKTVDNQATYFCILKAPVAGSTEARRTWATQPALCSKFLSTRSIDSGTCG